MEKLEQKIRENSAVATDELTRFMLIRSGLDAVMKSINVGKQTETALSRLPGMDGGSLGTLLRSQFDPFLAELNIEMNRQLHRLSHATASHLTREICVQAIQRFVQEYGLAVDAIMDPKNGYEFPRSTVLLRTVEEVETVIGLARLNLQVKN
jgi:hypothetical protein